MEFPIEQNAPGRVTQFEEQHIAANTSCNIPHRQLARVVQCLSEIQNEIVLSVAAKVRRDSSKQRRK